MTRSFFTVASFLISVAAGANSLQAPRPAELEHPGSNRYEFSFRVEKLSCRASGSQRDVHVFLPTKNHQPVQAASLVVYGHGQAMPLSVYRATFEHMAGKGVAVAFPDYSTHFFDRNWERMADDFNTLTACVLAQFPKVLSNDRVIFAGHSKGAYVASMALPRRHPAFQTKAAVLFAPAGVDVSIEDVSPEIALTVVLSTDENIVKPEFSQTMVSQAPVRTKQLFTVTGYVDDAGVAQKVGHFWVLTDRFLTVGQKPNSLHFHSAWKWLVAAAWDVRDGNKQANPYIYGDLSTEKGLNQRDFVER